MYQPVCPAGNACVQVQKYLIEQRRPALEAIQQGFCDLDLTDHLEVFTGLELAALFFGVQYLDVDQLAASFKLDQTEPFACQAAEWLRMFVRGLSETSIRVFLARVTNQVTLRPGQRILVEVSEAEQQPKFFPSSAILQLPTCATYDIFAARMAAALRLGEHYSRTEAQQDQRLTQAEEQAVVAAMRGEIRAGGYYRCACGFIYTVGECGGPMQRAPDVEAPLAGLDMHWNLAINMRNLMVHYILLGLSRLSWLLAASP